MERFSIHVYSVGYVEINFSLPSGFEHRRRLLGEAKPWLAVSLQPSPVYIIVSTTQEKIGSSLSSPEKYKISLLKQRSVSITTVMPADHYWHCLPLLLPTGAVRSWLLPVQNLGGEAPSKWSLIDIIFVLLMLCQRHHPSFLMQPVLAAIKMATADPLLQSVWWGLRVLTLFSSCRSSYTSGTYGLPGIIAQSHISSWSPDQRAQTTVPDNDEGRLSRRYCQA